jgi:hypothetical protein
VSVFRARSVHATGSRFVPHTAVAKLMGVVQKALAFRQQQEDELGWSPRLPQASDGDSGNGNGSASGSGDGSGRGGGSGSSGGGSGGSGSGSGGGAPAPAAGCAHCQAKKLGDVRAHAGWSRRECADACSRDGASDARWCRMAWRMFR